MKYTICKIKPKAPFHVGTKEGGLEETLHYIPSDTLFSAFCNVYRIVYGKEKLEEILEEFKNNPPFLISSAFPAVDDVIFFPLPKKTNLYSKDLEPKKLRKIEFVSEEIFKILLTEGEINVEKEWLTEDEKGLVKEKEIKKIWWEREIPRVTIDRITNSSEIYYQGEVRFDGLHFLIDLRNEKYEKEIETTIKVMGEEGIGGERTYGKGLFEVREISKIEFDETESPWHITLSLFHPSKDELKGLKGYYEFMQRGGWVYSPEEKGIRRKFVRMFVEGCVFNKKVIGDMVEVAKGKHPVYRYGYAFVLPIKVKK